MLDDKGQVSFEYLMIFTISLIILIVFTLPLTQHAISDTLDVSNTLNVKSDLSKISQAIKVVYGQGQGSRQEVSLHESQKIKVTISKDSLSCSLKLKDKTKKTIKQYYNSNLEKTSMTLEKGDNNIVVEWPVGSENMVIYKQ